MKMKIRKENNRKLSPLFTILTIHMLAIFRILLRYAKFLIIALRYLQDSLSGPGVK